MAQDGSSVTGGSGFLSHFEPNERRTVRALSDARLVLPAWPGVGTRRRSRSPAPRAERVSPLYRMAVASRRAWLRAARVGVA